MRMEIVSIALLAGSFAIAWAPPASAESRMWVGAEDLKRHTCPSNECGVVGRLFFRESVIVYQKKNGWSRISGYGGAGCYEGVAAFVQLGRSDCSPENGISEGDFAEWVRSDALKSEKPL